MTALHVIGRPRRLAAVDVPDRRRQADLRRHLLAAGGPQGRRARPSAGSRRILTDDHRAEPRQGEGTAASRPTSVAELTERRADAGRPRRRPGRARPRRWSTGAAEELRDRVRPGARRVRQQGAAGSAGTKFPTPPVAGRSSCTRRASRDKDADLTKLVTLDADEDGRGRHLRPARRRLPPLQHRAHLDRAALREDALRQRPTRRAVRRGLPRRPEAAVQAGGRRDARRSCRAR